MRLPCILPPLGYSTRTRVSRDGTFYLTSETDHGDGQAKYTLVLFLILHVSGWGPFP
jgi:hypothetical protein